ncbi:MAG: GDP-mannose 4,6-dehydratase [bacterium]|nr:GDP-mannose 4,6-dehydratase [bacterium]
MVRVALITGITGQDGSYLAEFLLAKGYQVFGLERRSSQKNRMNIDHILDRIELVSGDLLDEASVVHALKEVKPDEVYNLAAQSFVHESWKQPVFTGEVTGLGAVRVLEAIRQVNPSIKFYQASSSEMFGKVHETPQTEKTPFYPRSPYGVAKLYAHWITVNYRESYGMFAASGILFNHESPRRGLEFVTRKITNAIARIKLGTAKELVLGNLDAERDWGFAGDYVEAMWLMLQQKEARDYVIATGESHSIREFLVAAFKCVDLNWENYVRTDPKFIRPAEVNLLRGDSSLARKELDWKPRVGFTELVEMMVNSDLKALSK